MPQWQPWVVRHLYSVIEPDPQYPSYLSAMKDQLDRAREAEWISMVYDRPIRTKGDIVDVSEEEKLVTPPVPEYLSPLRWRWILFVTRRQEVRFLYWSPRHPAGHRRIRMFDRDGYDIGTLVWKVCDACRVGSINKISITTEYQRQGIGRRLIRRALADGSGYTWQTTGQSPEAKRFFPVLEKEMGTAFLQYGGVCEHLASPPGYRPPPTDRRPRPVLERGI